MLVEKFVEEIKLLGDEEEKSHDEDKLLYSCDLFR